MKLLKLTATNLILMLVDDSQTATAPGKSVRTVSSDEVTAIQTILTTGTRAVDDPAGIRAETIGEKAARQPARTIAARVTAIFQAQSDAMRIALLPLSGGIIAAVQATPPDYVAAKGAISAATNPAGSPLTGDQFTALQTSLIACFPS